MFDTTRITATLEHKQRHLVEDENDLDFVAGHHEHDPRGDDGDPVSVIAFIEAAPTNDDLAL